MEVGSIVIAPVPNHDGTVKPRPCLVLAVKQRLGQETQIVVAYGTSQRVDKLQPWELLVRSEDGPQAWANSGLTKPTAFCLDRRFTFTAKDIWHEIGRLSHVHHVALSASVEAAIKRGWH